MGERDPPTRVEREVTGAGELLEPVLDLRFARPAGRGERRGVGARPVEARDV